MSLVTEEATTCCSDPRDATKTDMEVTRDRHDDPERVCQRVQLISRLCKSGSISITQFRRPVWSGAFDQRCDYYTQGLKGRKNEGKIDDDHRLVDYSYLVLMLNGDKIVEESHPAPYPLTKNYVRIILTTASVV